MHKEVHLHGSWGSDGRSLRSTAVRDNVTKGRGKRRLRMQVSDSVVL